MVSDCTRRSPVTVAVTAPPPAVEVSTIDITSSCALSISSCRLCNCCSIPAPPFREPLLLRLIFLGNATSLKSYWRTPAPTGALPRLLAHNGTQVIYRRPYHRVINHTRVYR